MRPWLLHVPLLPSVEIEIEIDRRLFAIDSLAGLRQMMSLRQIATSNRPRLQPIFSSRERSQFGNADQNEHL